MEISIPSNFSPTFLLLQQEGYLISSSLSTGLTELRAAHVGNKGAFYAALFNLSVGIERLLKVIVIIDHMLDNNLVAPTKRQLQKRSHNILNLYDECRKLGAKQDVVIPSRTEIDEINQKLLVLLSEFALSARYHNLDSLSYSQINLDPLNAWSEIVFCILRLDVSKRQKDKIFAQTHIIFTLIHDKSIAIMHGLDKRPLNIFEVLSLPGLHQQAMRFAVLRVIRILSPFRDLSMRLDLKSYAYNPNTPFP